MKTSQDGFQQCYNAQIVVDGDSQLIVTTAVSDHASDQGQLPRLLDAVQAHYGHRPTQLLADAGYRNEEDLQELENRLRAQPPGRGHPAYADPTGHPTGSGNICPAQMAGGSTHRLDQTHPGFSPIRHARLAPGPGRVGSGVSGSEREAPAPPAAELSRLGPDSPRAPGRTAPVHPHVRHAPWFCAVRMPPDLRRPPVSALKAFLHTFWGADS